MPYVAHEKLGVTKLVVVKEGQEVGGLCVTEDTMVVRSPEDEGSVAVAFLTQKAFDELNTDLLYWSNDEVEEIISKGKAQ